MTFLRDLAAETPRWTWRDKLAALALTAHEAGLHPRCGHPTSLAFSPDAEGFYEIGTAVCQACAASEVYAASAAGQGSKPEPGTSVHTFNAAGPGERIRPWNGQLRPAPGH